MNSREWNRTLPRKCMRNYVFSVHSASPNGEECQAILMEPDNINIRHYASLLAMTSMTNSFNDLKMTKYYG
jgi:hypothetical protein